MNFPPVEWDPKKPEEQRDRFRAALIPVWDYTDVRSEEDVRGRPRSGEHKDHVIDIVGEGRLVGVRIIASREKQPSGEYLHVSASLHHGPDDYPSLYEELQKLFERLGVRELGPPVKMAKGRNVAKAGEDHYAAKFTWEVVEEIRAFYAMGGVSQRKLAGMYSTSAGNISDIISGRKWKLASGAGTTPKK
jgi:hypothetical protein